MYARTVLSSLFLFACLNDSKEAAAHPRGPGAPYSVSVEDESGRELRTFHHRGQTFVLGIYGERYLIRVENHTGRRIEAVVTVDGRDVISGRKGDFVNERGYLVEPYGEVVIEGFRQSLDEVAAFRFTSPGRSYSSRMGTPENVGVIGVAVFPERVHAVARRYEPPRDIAGPRRSAPTPSAPSGSRSIDDLRDGAGKGGHAGRAPASASAGRKSRSSGLGTRSPSAAPAPEAYRDRAVESERYAEAPRGDLDNLGTEYGESVSSAVREVAFARANPQKPAQVIALRYDDREGLIARGILYERPYAMRPEGPQPFPESRFAPPPPPYPYY